MSLTNIFFLFWAFLSTLGGGADPSETCWEDYNLELQVQGCTLIVDQKEDGSKEVTWALARRGYAYKFLGDAARANADFDRAIAGLDSIIRRNSLDSNALLARAIAHTGRNHFAQAIADYDEAIRVDPQNMELFNMRCWSRALFGTELEIATDDCDTAVRLSNNSPDHLDTRGLLRLKQGHFADAWSDYNAALQANTDPDTAHYLYGRGIAALRLGRIEEGNADLKEALKLNPNVAKMFADYGISP